MLTGKNCTECTLDMAYCECHVTLMETNVKTLKDIRDILNKMSIEDLTAPALCSNSVLFNKGSFRIAGIHHSECRNPLIKDQYFFLITETK